MSGPGYYKYRCKNFFTYNCGNWVWVNHSACAECVAAGRDSSESVLAATHGVDCLNPLMEESVVSSCSSADLDCGRRQDQDRTAEFEDQGTLPRGVAVPQRRGGESAHFALDGAVGLHCRQRW